MARTTLEHLTPGARLARPVLNADGVLLLKAGETLTPKHIQVLHAWGVRDVDVEDEGAQAAEAAPASPELRRRAEAEIARRFRRADDGHPAMAKIRRVATALLTRRLADEAERDAARRD